MDAGERVALSSGQEASLQRSLSTAREISGVCFGLRIGSLPGGRESALAAHAQLPDAARAVLVAVDPAARVIEIVTGTGVVDHLDDRSCELAILSMRSGFLAGDLVRGIKDGIDLLAQHARMPKVMNLDEPA
ncbi:MAG: DUF5130 domain-containing protein [Actinomycetales bacterium]|nr:DUF5130 domain-containing protein [Actinomycetales bacterium]